MSTNTDIQHYKLHSKNKKYAIYDIDYRCDVFSCMRVLKEITKQKTMREKNCKKAKKN